MAKIVLTGGGTAGHIIPNLALVPELKKHFEFIHYIGGNGMEKKIVKEFGLPFHRTDTVKLDRKNFLKNFKIPFVMHGAIRQARRLLQEIKPSAVFSKGGYASLPTCFAAKKENIPIIVHESDISLGVANRVVSKFAALTLTSFEETKGGIYVGNPIREEIFEGDREAAIRKYKIKKKPVLLIMGGSAGSTAINDVTYKALDKLTEKFFVIHISGEKGDFSIKYKDYVQIPFAKDINDLFACADVVVSRAGANTLAELTALNKKILAIPLPKGLSRGDQVENALSYEKKGKLLTLEQIHLTPQTFIEYINRARFMQRTFSSSEETKTVNRRIVDKILEAINKKI
ncbi:MAG: UDP-N-acetylglucosamine--N-acetylmuramyl-(pentapeptide) pyrophosphoryl-undecaprenol N-acetylglucosamine transferase [Bacillota bacterium]|nr:UDP-N-acetylglucosamine--N-acetylmuramyl-(pentapeptide) pyrophosphoryl-undecaprenol N-acetylglucosamine transferase [Bacillota bacterium]HHU42723.1 UDP-N-acetylglucosamine--N-acetylmuramyl-(pentapeptide) pyrophosphoryl-undecaprenol N-acetylglucosamine transferase [Clostridiales bacterium]